MFVNVLCNGGFISTSHVMCSVNAADADAMALRLITPICEKDVTPVL